MRSSFIRVLQFIFVTWIFYLLIFAVIEAVTRPVKDVLGFSGLSETILILIAGILMLAPFIVFWNWYVLGKYYPRHVKALSKQEAS